VIIKTFIYEIVVRLIFGIHLSALPDCNVSVEVPKAIWFAVEITKEADADLGK
jgi:hypothetical protein